MPHDAKIDFEKVAKEIVMDSNSRGPYALKPDDRIFRTCTYITLDEYSWFPSDPKQKLKWLDYWKEKRNTYLDRFGLVPKEIELFILEKTLRDHFGKH